MKSDETRMLQRETGLRDGPLPSLWRIRDGREGGLDMASFPIRPPPSNLLNPFPLPPSPFTLRL